MPTKEDLETQLKALESMSYQIRDKRFPGSDPITDALRTNDQGSIHMLITESKFVVATGLADASLTKLSNLTSALTEKLRDALAASTQKDFLAKLRLAANLVRDYRKT